jgi:hypothetical protein
VFQIIPFDIYREVQEVIVRAYYEINCVPFGRNWPLMKKLRDILEHDH